MRRPCASAVSAPRAPVGHAQTPRFMGAAPGLACFEHCVGRVVSMAWPWPTRPRRFEHPQRCHSRHAGQAGNSRTAALDRRGGRGFRPRCASNRALSSCNVMHDVKRLSVAAPHLGGEADDALPGCQRGLGSACQFSQRFLCEGGRRHARIMGRPPPWRRERRCGSAPPVEDWRRFCA